MPPHARGPRRPAAGWAGGSRARPARPPAPGCRDSGAQYVGSRDAGLVRTGGSQRCRGAQSLPNGKSGRRVTLRDSGVSVLHIGRKCKDTKTSRKETNVRSEARTAPAASAEEGELQTSAEVSPGSGGPRGAAGGRAAPGRLGPFPCGWGTVSVPTRLRAGTASPGSLPAASRTGSRFLQLSASPLY